MRNEQNRVAGVRGNEIVNTSILIFRIGMWSSCETRGHHVLNIFAGAQNIIQLLSININKTFLVMRKFKFSSKPLDETTRYRLTNSPSWKTSFPTVNLLWQLIMS
jgi:hypothetical protein